MRIVEMVNTLEIGGTERLVVDLASELKAKGHQVSVVCLRGGGPLAQQLDRVAIDIDLLKKPEGPALRTLFRLISYLRKNRVDVVHSHNPLVHHYAVAAGRIAGVPVIVNTIHGPGNLSVPAGLKEFLYGAMCHWSDSIVAVCPTAFRTFHSQKIIPTKKLTTINNGIPLNGYLESIARERDTDIVFGIVGRLAKVKDHRTLLSAFSVLRKSRPDCRLEILGDGPLRSELEIQTKDLDLADYVTFHGHSADVRGFLRHVDIAVLCSVSEGLPLSILEAMASGLPVIGTDVGETRSLIESADAGWSCPPSRHDLLANAMLLAANCSIDDRNAMGWRGRSFVVANYSLQEMTSGYENLFSGLLTSKQKSL